MKQMNCFTPKYFMTASFHLHFQVKTQRLEFSTIAISSSRLDLDGFRSFATIKRTEMCSSNAMFYGDESHDIERINKSIVTHTTTRSLWDLRYPNRFLFVEIKIPSKPNWSQTSMLFLEQKFG